VTFASFPTANVKVSDDLRSPLTREFTTGLGRQLGTRGQVKGTYAWRKTTHLVEDFVDLSNGIVNVPLVGALTTRVLGNSDVPKRSYSAFITQLGLPAPRASHGWRAIHGTDQRRRQLCR
jgi:hypothetical protein